MANVEAPTISVEIVVASENDVTRERVMLARGSRAVDALKAAKNEAIRNALPRFEPVSHIADSHVGVWGRRVLPTTVLNEGDRIELYRAVTADAKSARLARAREQGYRWQGRTRRAAATQVKPELLP